ncbi:hypothetical protein SLEP1_g23521 [Rubroshorea leprosula]|uniref:Uncharacterized protein n=1 Tax=Rubroshorea leprosula TaxID=152421 RepID=A0AAV5JHV8_9ROSI|nr:hypothetical protein SLEP1_g23521 [Rubroshorea leprosula]
MKQVERWFSSAFSHIQSVITCLLIIQIQPHICDIFSLSLTFPPHKQHLSSKIVNPISTLPPKSATDLFSYPLDSHPLWFKPTLFLLPDFDSEFYILERRTFVPFDTFDPSSSPISPPSTTSFLTSSIVTILTSATATSNGLFVNLSTKLVDVYAAVVRMRVPLLELRERIQGFRTAVESLLVALRNGLSQRSEAAAAREVLELLLDTFHVVSRVEKLIKEPPSVPSDWSHGDMNLKNALSNGSSAQHVKNGTNIRETQSMLLERIASEVNRLKFYIAHAQNLPFIQNMDMKIESASLLLDARLGHCFVDGLENRDANAFYNCLCAYAAIDNPGSAEECFTLL